ncbi:helix-turn-helix domain-containing protein [Streptomyces bobili]|uniref:helix-turn-helix domain-containing protein n=1 Tax=Streptomyces bobili TaxID=67280 RepID=UPI0036E0DFFA
MSQPSSMPGMDPSTVVTPRQLRSCLRALRERRGLSYAELDDRAGKLAPFQDRTRRLPASTLSDLLADKDITPSKDVVLTFLAACSVSRDDLPQWLAAWERASTADLAMPEGAVRVSDARPRLLGVHASIQVDDCVADDQPD